MHIECDAICISASVQISSVFLTQTIHLHRELLVSASCKSK